MMWAEDIPEAIRKRMHIKAEPTSKGIMATLAKYGGGRQNVERLDAQYSGIWIVDDLHSVQFERVDSDEVRRILEV